MEHLFGPSQTQFPRINRARPTRQADPRRTFEKRYGSSNPSIFHLHSDLVKEVAPKPKVKPLMPLHEKDPFGEWLNAEHEDCISLLRVVLSLPNDYTASIAYLRSMRPTTSAAGLKFWNAPIPRAHLMNALLLRENRTIEAVHVEAKLKHDRTYEYLRNWNVNWQRLPVEKTQYVTDGAGATYQAKIVSLQHRTGTGTLRLDGYTLTIPCRYDVREHVWRTRDTLDLERLVALPIAAQVIGFTAKFAAKVLPVVTTTAPHGRPLVHPDTLSALVPEHLHREHLPDALKNANLCRCCFFNVQTGRCDLGHRPLPEVGTAAYACEDHANA